MRTGACTHGPDCDCDMVACDDCAALREENARLRQRVEELEREAGILTQGITDQHDRAEAAEAEVARLEGLILRVDDMLYERKQPIIILSQEARRIRAQREGKCPECEGTGATGAGVPCCIRAAKGGRRRGSDGQRST